MRIPFGSGKRRANGEPKGMAVEAARGRFLIEESPEIVLVVDEQDRLIAASRRARETLEGLAAGTAVPPEILAVDGRQSPVVIPYRLGESTERLVYLSRGEGDLAAYEELRAGFTAAVSHELRTPLARLLAILESAELPHSDHASLIAQARGEVDQIRELIDDVLFLSELETGREIVALGRTTASPVLEAVVAELAERAERTGVRLRLECDPAVAFPLRPRMLRVVAANLAENALRYAGEGATFTLEASRSREGVVLVGRDDGAGVPADALPRLFERFYRADPARTSRGTGLGLAIVKHVVTSAGGTAEARGAPGAGLEIVCSFFG